MKLSEQLKNLRKEHSLTQKELAKIIQVDQASISLWEKEINEPKASYIIALADYFKISTDFLLGRVDEFDNPIQQNISSNNNIHVKNNIKISNSFNGNMHK